MKKRRGKRRHDEHGVTLLEVMISMSVFAIGMSGLAPLNIMAARAGESARRVDRATLIARDTLRHISRLPFDHSALIDTLGGRGTVDLLDDGDVFRQQSVPSTSYDHLVDTSANNADTVLRQSATEPFEGMQITCATPPCAEPHLDFNFDDGADFERYWRVSNHPARSGELAPPAKDIAVYVTWRDPATLGRRRVVLFTTKFNPSLLNP